MQMGKAGHKLFSLILAIALAIGCSPVAALAAEDSDLGSSSSSSEALQPVESSSSSGSDSNSSSSSSASGSSSPSGDLDSSSGSEPSSSSAGQEEPERYYVDALLLKWDEPDDDGVSHFVGDNPIVEKSYRTISISEFGEKVQLNGWYLSTDGTGVAYQTSDSGTRIGAFDLTWESSDQTVATVDPNGMVVPKGKNGSTTIKATVADANVYEGKAPEAVVTVVYDGQEGKYVERVDILDDVGNAIGESWGGITVYTKENEFHQLHARVTWRNVATGQQETEITGSGEDYSASGVGTTLTWAVSASNTFSINEDTGRLRAGVYAGSAYVTCTAIGGLGGKAITDTASVQLDTGKYEYDPAESLTLKVVWEERPDEVVKEASYTYDELLGRLESTHVNATVSNASRYGVISADGWLFKDVVELVSVADADVMQYRFTTRDGYDNPVSYRYLFESGNRYYFPNYDIGSRAEGKIVPPVLAYRSALIWNSSEANPDATLDDGNRFRLVFGCLGEGDANTSFQIYYITGITIVLKGAPPAGVDAQSPEGKETAKRPESGNAPAEADTAKPGGEEPASGGGGGSKPGGVGKGFPASATSKVAGAGGQADTPEGVGAAKRWRVYQMMNKIGSDVPDWDDENPLSPFAAPLAVGALAVGAGATAFGFRMRLR